MGNVGEKRKICFIFSLSTEPTRILTQPGYNVVHRNSMAVFECKVKHDPTLFPSMIWLKDNGELPEDPRYDLRSVLQLLFKYKQGSAP